MSERLVVVRTCLNGLEAEMLKAELEASGIPVQLRGGSNVLPPLVNIRGIHLAVPEWAAEDAIALLRPIIDDEEPPRVRPAHGVEERPRNTLVDRAEERPRPRPGDIEEHPRTRPAYGQELPRRQPPR